MISRKVFKTSTVNGQCWNPHCFRKIGNKHGFCSRCLTKMRSHSARMAELRKVKLSIEGAINLRDNISVRAFV